MNQLHDQIPAIYNREFADRYWQEKFALFKSAVNVGQYALSSADIEFLLRSLPLLDRRAIDVIGGNDQVRATIGAREVWNGSEPFEAISSGSTLRICQIHLHRRLLSELCEAIQEHFLATVDANAYITPGSQIGLNWHIDHHDVVVMQIAGSKLWKVASVRLPYTPKLPRFSFERRSVRTQMERPRIGKEIDCEELVLEPGDVLYIPPGTPHCTIAVGEEWSVSVSISIRPMVVMDLMLSVLKQIAMSDRLLLKTIVGGTLSNAEKDNIVRSFKAISEEIDVEVALDDLLRTRRGGHL